LTVLTLNDLIVVLQGRTHTRTGKKYKSQSEKYIYIYKQEKVNLHDKYRNECASINLCVKKFSNLQSGQIFLLGENRNQIDFLGQ
jgi:hypothetical protein